MMQYVLYNVYIITLNVNVYMYCILCSLYTTNLQGKWLFLDHRELSGSANNFLVYFWRTDSKNMYENIKIIRAVPLNSMYVYYCIVLHQILVNRNNCYGHAVKIYSQ